MFFRRESLIYLFRKISWRIVPFAIVIGITGPISAHAATLYWVGNDGADTSVASNWKTTNPATCGSGNASAAPSTSDTAIFDADCDNGASINAALSVTSMTLSSGYEGVVTLRANTTISSTLTQAEGVLILNGQTLSTRTLTISAGTFTAGTGTLLLSGAASTINVDSTLTLYNLTINGTTATTKTISSSDTLIVTNTLSLTDGLVSQSTIPAVGTIRAQGAIVQASTFDGGTARIAIDGTSDQVFTGNSTRTEGLLPLVRIDKSTGTLTLSGTIRTASHWNFSGGTLAYTDSTVIFSNAALTIRGSHSLSNVIFDQNSVTARTYTIASDTTLTVLGTLTLDNSTDSTSAAKITINGGIIRARGDISLPDNVMNHTGTTNLIIDGTSDQLLSGNAANSTGGLIALNIDKASGTLTLSGTIRTVKTWSYSGGTIDPGTSTVIFGATLTIAGSHTLGNVRFDNYKTAMTVTITAATTLTVGGSLTLDQGANAGAITINTGTIHVKGDVTIPDTLAHTGTAQLYINGTADQLLSANSTARVGDLLALTINKPSGTLTLSGIIRTTKNWTYTLGTFDATTNLSTVVFAGSQQLSGTHTLYNVTMTGSVTSHTVQTGGTLITAAGMLTLSDGYLRGGILEATGDVVHESTFDGGNGTLRLSGNAVRTLSLTANDELPGLSITGPNVTISAPSTGNMYIRGSFSQSAGTFNGQGSDVHVTGDLSVSGGTFTAPSGTLTVIGTFTCTAGTFSHNSGEVILSASGRILTPPSSFNDVTLSEGLMAYWKFDETSGTIAADSSGFGHDGTYVGDPVYSSEYSSNHQFSNGGSLSLSGDDYIDMGDIEGLESSFSLSIWIKSVGASGMLMSKSVENINPAPKKQWALYTNDEPELWVYPPGSGTAVEQRSLTRMDDNEWHHVAAMYDAQNRQMFIYVNGDLTDGTQVNGNLPNYTHNSIQQVMIGAYINAGNNPAIFFTGLIDEARIYNRVLSSAEVVALAAGTQFPTVDYTLGASLAVADTLTLNHVDLDPSDDCYDIDYGTLMNNGGTIGSCGGSSSSSTSSTTTSTITSTPPSRGGHRGSIQGMAQKIAAAKGLIVARFNQGAAHTPPEIIEDVATGKISLKKPLAKADTNTMFALRGRVAMAQGMNVLVFRDVPVNEWFTPFVSTLIEEKIAEGYKDTEGNLTGEFGVSNSVTYAEILKLALEAAGKTPDEKVGPPRNTSAKGSWAEGCTKMAEDLGISVIRPDTNVHSPATRGEVIQILLEVLQIPVGSSVRLPYKDVPKNHPHVLAIDAATYFGLVEGDKDSKGNTLQKFRPDDKINRAEVAKIIALAVRMLEGQ